MRYIVIERFRDGNAKPVYRRFQERGRLLPEGLIQLDSWVDLPGGRCFQLMETEEAAKLQEWIACWEDLVDFEVVAVIDSAEAMQQTLGSG